MNCYSIRAGVGRWILLGLVGGLSMSDGGAIEKVEAPLDQAVDEEIVADSVAPADDPRDGAPVRQERSRLGEIVKLGGEVIIARGEEARDVVIVFGSVRVEGWVRGDMVVVGGSAYVDGVIEGNLVVPLGKLTLGPDAEVEGDLVVVLGELSVDPGAIIGGERFELTLSALEAHLPPMTGLRRWVMEGVILGRLLPHQPGWWWWFASACAILLVVTALIFPRPIAYGVNALETRPLGSFFLGLLVFLLFGPLLLLLVATGVGILVVPFVLCGGCVAYFLGKAAVYQYLGRQVGRQTGLAFLQLPLLALLLGIALFYAMYVIPVVGLLAWLLAGLLGLGAVVLAFFDAFRADGAAPIRIVAAPPVFALPTGGTLGVSAPPLIPGQPPVPPVVEPGSLARVGFWMRLLATFIDLLLVGALTSMIQRGAWFLPLWMAYHIGFWAWRGTTVGGVVLGLKIVRGDGRDIDFPIALIRCLSSFLSAMALFIGFFWAGWTRERVAWHDQIAGTIVVKMPRGVPLF
jgi:uncharacterized RDD family membrane protein YckC